MFPKSAQPESIAVNRNKTGSGPTSDIARLCGARFVNIAEPDKTMVLDAALVKSLTGRDEITARYLHKEFFSFVPQFVLFMNINYLPRVDDITLFTSGRIFCIPFPVHFAPDKQERSLVELFSEPEAVSAIFNWILEGYADYQVVGVKDNIPSVVKDALREYEEISDTFGQFLNECIVTLKNHFTATVDIYQVYYEWTTRNGGRPMNQNNVTKAMKQRGYKYDRPSGKARGFHDITISPYFPREQRYRQHDAL